ATASLYLPITPKGSQDEIVVNAGSSDNGCAGPDYSEYVLHKVDGSEVHFCKASSLWLSTKDRWGNTIKGAYGTNGQLATITDVAGRAITLSYTGGLLSVVQLPNSGPTWNFIYNNGQLTEI